VSSQEKEDERSEQTLSRLSGGQKAVVAACLIFAIQQIDHSPFYILDEFDSALDPEYTAGIASHIQKMASGYRDSAGIWHPSCQFIMTSFKEDMAKHAHRHF